MHINFALSRNNNVASKQTGHKTENDITSSILNKIITIIASLIISATENIQECEICHQVQSHLTVGPSMYTLHTRCILAPSINKNHRLQSVLNLYKKGGTVN